MRGTDRKKLDPLFQLFEHFMLTRSYEDSAKFTKEVAEQYLGYLDSTLLAHIPSHVRDQIKEDLEAEAREMLVKKMYGCVKSEDYRNFGMVVKVTKTEELIAIDFETPAPPAPPTSAKEE